MIRPIGPRLYSPLPDAQLNAVVRANWSQVVSRLFPEALLSHRSALEYRPDADGVIFLTSTTNRIVRYPGLTLRFLRGPAALASDPDFLSMRASSFPRALLENLTSTRSPLINKVLPPEAIENRLEQIFHANGELGLGALRDEARKISVKLGWKQEFERLSAMIGALLGSRPLDQLKGKSARARAMGRPYDSACLEKLELLFGELRHFPVPEIQEAGKGAEHFRNKAFFEAYFSNYIEGTTFEVSEAESIVFDRKIPGHRPKDAHDILGTFLIVSDLKEMRITPQDPVALRRLLTHRHHTMLEGRSEARPGQFKSKPNRAGDTHFVHPEYIVGTFDKGYELYRNLPKGLARAIYMMFLIAEIHPFTDGNGRIARIMMNSELHAAGLPTIIIPTVYREDYLLALRAFRRRNRPRPLIEMLVSAQKFSNLPYSPYPKALAGLEARSWFLEPEQGRILSTD